MDVTYSQQIGHERLAASIMKLPDGRHAAEITSTTDDTGEAVLWSRVFTDTDSIMTMTGTLAVQFSYFVARRNGHGPDSRPRD